MLEEKNEKCKKSHLEDYNSRVYKRLDDGFYGLNKCIEDKIINKGEQL